jgi:uncharacterized protein (DUF2141 family)
MVNFKFATASSVVAIATLLLNIHPTVAGYSGNLEVKFNSLKNSKGQVCLSLFSGSKGFPSGGRTSNLKLSRCVALAKGTSSVTFTNLPYGNYAIAAIHDINGDNRLNTNAFGIPSEGFGFSNNPALRAGPASYAECQFFLSGTKTVVQIQMRYLN